MKVGELVLTSMAGKTVTVVEVRGIEAKRIYIRALERTQLAGRNRFLERGQTTLVPRGSIQNIRKVQL